MGLANSKDLSDLGNRLATIENDVSNTNNSLDTLAQNIQTNLQELSERPRLQQCEWEKTGNKSCREECENIVSGCRTRGDSGFDYSACSIDARLEYTKCDYKCYDRLKCMRGAFHKDFADAKCNKETGQYMPDGGENVVLCKDFWSVEKIQKAFSGEEENLMCVNTEFQSCGDVNTCPHDCYFVPKFFPAQNLFQVIRQTMGPPHEHGGEIKNRTKNFMYVE